MIRKYHPGFVDQTLSGLLFGKAFRECAATIARLIRKGYTRDSRVSRNLTDKCTPDGPRRAKYAPRETQEASEGAHEFGRQPSRQKKSRDSFFRRAVHHARQNRWLPGRPFRAEPRCFRPLPVPSRLNLPGDDECNRGGRETSIVLSMPTSAITIAPVLFRSIRPLPPHQKKKKIYATGGFCSIRRHRGC